MFIINNKVFLCYNIKFLSGSIHLLIVLLMANVVSGSTSLLIILTPNAVSRSICLLIILTPNAVSGVYVF